MRGDYCCERVLCEGFIIVVVGRGVEERFIVGGVSEGIYCRKCQVDGILKRGQNGVGAYKSDLSDKHVISPFNIHT